MGALAETIKAAEAKEAAGLSDTLNLLQREADVPVGDKSLSTLQSAGIPTAGDESKRRLWKWVAGIGGTTLALGAALRLMRAAGESARRKELLEDVDEAAGAPGREVTIPIPRKKKASLEKQAIWPWLAAGAVAAPSALSALGETAGSAWRKTKETVGKGYEHLFEPTGSAFTNPWTLPLMYLTGIAATYGGYKLTDALISKLQKRRRAKELGRARSEFERALSTQFSEKPASIIGAAVDGVAQAYVDGTLEKQAATVTQPAGTEQSWWESARGGGGAALGGYLALLTLLASLGAAGGYHWIKKRETPRRKYEAAKELLLRRQLAAPPKVTVDTGE